jgi:hypothetical protein
MRFPSAIAKVAVVLTVALAATAAQSSAAEFQNYALKSVSTSLSSYQAGAHADFTTAFALTESGGKPYALTRDIEVHLPPGLVGNPQNLPRCTDQQFGSDNRFSACPLGSQVGITEISLGGEAAGFFTEPIYNMVSPGGDIVARLGFYAGPYPAFINVRVDPVDYSLVATIEGAPAAAELLSAITTLWGVPAASSHDTLRLTPAEAFANQSPPVREAGIEPTPFLVNPSQCGVARSVTVTARSYQLPEAGSTMSAPLQPMFGCGKLTFEPSLTVVPTSTEAAAPTGVDATLTLPQIETAKSLGTATLRSAVVTLPPGLTINPSAGDGLAACSSEQVGFGTTDVASCPPASKIGTAEIDVPALEHLLNGAVYQRTPEPGHLFRFWLVTDEQGVHLKLPAEIVANPLTGQLQTVFDGVPALGGNPQVPITSLSLHVFGGPRAPLSTPASCGHFKTEYLFTSWSGLAPAQGMTEMVIDSGCGKGGFSPQLQAGTTNPSAGTYSPFSLQLSRRDGEQSPVGVSTTLPPGLLADLGSVEICPDNLAAVGACPESSQVGRLVIAAGVGSSPLIIPQPGKEPTAIYLAGPYRGGPYSLVFKVPAQAGPFDLGTVLVRAAIFVDLRTAAVTVNSDALPQILEGVPVSYRLIDAVIDRPHFTLNPTNCAPLSIEAAVTSANGALAKPVAGFQASNCAALAFKPSLKLSLKGATKRTGHPALKAVVTYPQKGTYANIANARVSLPHSEFLDQGNLDKVCTQPELKTDTCPKTSVYGHAKAWTPLLSKPLQGPVYLGVGFGYKLPALVADLNGQIRVLLVGKIDTDAQNGIRSTFETVPDAPVSRFVLEMKGGKRYGLLENSENVCRAAQGANVAFVAQSGKQDDKRIAIANSCKKKRP